MRVASALHWTLLGALLASPVATSAQSTSSEQRGVEQAADGIDVKDGLRIENGPNQGLGYTDTLGTKYNYRYIAATITNDSTVPMHLQMALSEEYAFPAPYGDQKFRVFLLPRELTPDQVTFDSTSYELGNNDLRGFFDGGLDPTYVLNETLEPGEECVVTIGTLYVRGSSCGVVPNALFAQTDKDVFPDCDCPLDQGEPTSAQLALGLKLDFCSIGNSPCCTVIPCGRVSYPEP